MRYREVVEGLERLGITNFIQPYLHQFFNDSHSLNVYRKPQKDLSIDASYILRQLILAKILSKLIGNYYDTVY